MNSMDRLRDLIGKLNSLRKANWDESKHPRNPDGKFGSGGGEAGGKESAGKEPSRVSGKMSMRESFYNMDTHAVDNETKYGYFGSQTGRNPDHDEFVADTLERMDINPVAADKYLNSTYGRHLADDMSRYGQDPETGEYDDDDVQSMGEAIERNYMGYLKANPHGSPEKKEYLERLRDRVSRKSSTAADILKDFDEGKHPRGADGKFSSGGGESASSGERSGKEPINVSEREMSEMAERGRHGSLPDPKDIKIPAGSRDEQVQDLMEDFDHEMSNTPFEEKQEQLMMHMRNQGVHQSEALDEVASMRTDQVDSKLKEIEQARLNGLSNDEISEAHKGTFQAESDRRRHEPYSQDMMSDEESEAKHGDPEYHPSDEERDDYSDKVTKGITHTTEILRDMITRVNRISPATPLNDAERTELQNMITELAGVQSYLENSLKQGSLKKGAQK